MIHNDCLNDISDDMSTDIIEYIAFFPLFSSFSHVENFFDPLLVLLWCNDRLYQNIRIFSSNLAVIVHHNRSKGFDNSFIEYNVFTNGYCNTLIPFLHS